MDRRGFLALLGAGAGLGLAGCSGDPRDTDPEGSVPSPAPTDSSPVGPPDAPSNVPPLDGSWESHRHDAGNTAATDDPGPAAEPTEVWRRATATATGEPATSPAATGDAFFVPTRSGVLYARAADDGAVRWSIAPTAGTEVAPVASDGTVVLAAGDGLLGLAVDSGEERWTAAVDGTVTGLATTGDGVVAATGSGLTAVAAADGAERWRHRVDGTISTPPASGGATVAVGRSSGAVLAVDTETGERRWRASVGTEVGLAPAVGDAAVYVGAGSRLVALEEGNGSERWTFGTAHPIAAPPVPVDGAVCLATLDGDAESGRTGTAPPGADGTPTPTAADVRWLAADVVAVSPGDGSERWRAEETARYSFTSGPPASLPLAAAGDRVFLVVGDELIAYDAATGGTVWSVTADAVTPAVADGVVSTGRVGVDVSDGSVRWRFRTGGGIGASPAVVGNTAYVGSDDQYLYALAANAGTVDWAVPTDGMVRASPVVGDDAVYVGTTNGSLYAFDRADGTERWRAGIGGQVQSPALDDGTLYVGTFSRTLFALDAADGSERWRTEVDGERFVALTLSVSGESVFGGANGDLRAFDAADGSERWRVTADREVVQSTPVAARGTVFVNMGDSLRAFDAEDGSERWSRSTGGAHESPALHDDTVYASGDGSVYALDAADGTERWRTGVGDDLALAVGSEAVYGLSFDTPVLALDRSDGSVRWRQRGFVGTTAPALAGEYLFVGDDTGRVRAIGPTPE
ncbi:MAG: PQQ-binding-like beta-propeller repeat protein [Haloarculaceae archaeon]